MNDAVKAHEHHSLCRDLAGMDWRVGQPKRLSLTVGKITRALGVDTMALADVPAADLRESDEPCGSYSCQRHGQRGGQTQSPSGACDALDGSDITGLLHVAARLLHGKAATIAAERDAGWQEPGRSLFPAAAGAMANGRRGPQQGA
jgi:hypothetical protein